MSETSPNKPNPTNMLNNPPSNPNPPAPLPPLQPYPPFPQEMSQQPPAYRQPNPEVGQQFADEAKAKASVPTETKTFTITWPAEMGASWMTCKNLEQIIKNCCPGTQFKVSE